MTEEHRTLSGIDIQNVGLYDLKGVVKEFLAAISKISQEHYPERAGKICVLNAPGWFSMMWNVIKLMLHPNTQKKVFILSESAAKTTMKTLIAQESVPVECVCGARAKRGRGRSAGAGEARARAKRGRERSEGASEARARAKRGRGRSEGASEARARAKRGRERSKGASECNGNLAAVASAAVASAAVASLTTTTATSLARQQPPSLFLRALASLAQRRPGGTLTTSFSCARPSGTAARCSLSLGSRRSAARRSTALWAR
jgi:hypothetical protein